MPPKIEIAGDDHLRTLRNCGGYYECPKDKKGTRHGPLVGYAGKYKDDKGNDRQWVGEVYVNFAKAEIYPRVIKFFADCLTVNSFCSNNNGLFPTDFFCGAPIGGYSFADALAFRSDIPVIKAEKKIVELATPTSREKSQLVFGRHNIEAGKRYVIVEDVCNNFSTTSELINLIINYGGRAVAIVCFLNRSETIGSDYYLPLAKGCLCLPVVSVVQKVIKQWKQDDPAVAEDVAKGNVVWKPKDEWPRLESAMAGMD